MRVFRSLRHPGLAAHCALTIGNFDGVHRGHQAMLALLVSEAAHRGLPATVLTFEPNPRDYFAALRGQPESAPARIATLRDKLCELERCGVAQAVVMRFDAAFAAQSPEAFVADVLVTGLGARYVLVGDDFRYGARRAGDYAMLDAAGARHGFDVARMLSYEVHGLRVSSSAVRAALAAGDMAEAAALLGRPYSVSGRVVHGARLGRVLGETSAGRGDGFRTLNVRFGHPKPAAMGIFVVRVHGLGCRTGRRRRQPRQAADGRRQRPRPARGALPRLARALGAEGGYGRLVRVELLHKLRDEARYDSLAALAAAIGQDARDARVFLAAEAEAHAATGRQTTRDRI
jgi:riboflavin kinase/FMN adenylyltransferase